MNNGIRPSDLSRLAKIAAQVRNNGGPSLLTEDEACNCVLDIVGQSRMCSTITGDEIESLQLLMSGYFLHCRATASK